MWLYDLSLRAYGAAIAVAAHWNPKARLWKEGRRGLFERMAQAIAPGERIVWLHVSSLGEFEQGRPLMEQLHKDYPDYKILLTFFSPSGYEIRKNYPGADYIFYLPLDLKRNARRFLDVVKPEIAIFVKYEFWLNLLGELRRRQIRTFVVSAIFRRNSIFFKWYGWLWRRALKSFETIFVQDSESKKLLSELKFHSVVVAGDTRFDRVASIAAAAKRIETIERFKNEHRLFVAGSTWGPDEEILIELIDRNPDIRFVVAPHEMEEARIDSLQQRVRGGSMRYTKCDAQTSFDNCQVLILDTVGMLSSVYRYADWAYIGGGFGVGIHNTLEAATFGIPIAFGPNYHKFKEARDMISLGAARSVSGAAELIEWFGPLRDDEAVYEKTAHKAEEYTARHRGATSLILNTIFHKK